MHVVPKHGVDGSLISLAMAAKKNKYTGSRRSVICFFFPGQRMARLKKSGPSSGLSEKSISESRSASTRFQLVLDRFFVLFAFTMGCLSKRDDTNGLGSTFRKDHDGSAAANRADSNPAAFSVVFSHIGREEKDAAKHLFRIRQVETMFSNVLPVLVFIPFEPIGRRLFIDFQGHS